MAFTVSVDSVREINVGLAEFYERELAPGAEREEIEAPPSDPAPLAVAVGNTWRAVSDRHVEWTAFVRSSDASRIASVTFHLHPSFSPATIKVDSAPLKSLGWAGARLIFESMSCPPTARPSRYHTHFHSAGAQRPTPRDT